METKNTKRSEDPVFGSVSKDYPYFDPLFNSDRKAIMNRELGSCYFKNDSAVSMDEKVCAVIHKKEALKKFKE